MIDIQFCFLASSQKFTVSFSLCMVNVDRTDFDGTFVCFLHSIVLFLKRIILLDGDSERKKERGRDRNCSKEEEKRQLKKFHINHRHQSSGQYEKYRSESAELNPPFLLSLSTCCTTAWAKNCLFLNHAHELYLNTQLSHIEFETPATSLIDDRLEKMKFQQLNNETFMQNKSINLSIEEYRKSKIVERKLILIEIFFSSPSELKKN